MNIHQACFFTGHRNIKNTPLLREQISEAIQILADHGVHTFLCGGALGFDMLCADRVLTLKQSYGYDIALALYLPCHNQDLYWNECDKEHLRYLRVHANQLLYVTNGGYVPACMKERNYRMVDDAMYGIAYFNPNNSRSGTGQTIRYALQNGRKINNLFKE